MSPQSPTPEPAQSATTPTATEAVKVGVWYDGDTDATVGLSDAAGRELEVRVAIGDRWHQFAQMLTMLTPHLRRDTVRDFLDQLRGAGMGLSGFTEQELDAFTT